MVVENWQATLVSGTQDKGLRGSTVCCRHTYTWQMHRDGWLDKNNYSNCDRKLLTSAGHGEQGER